MRNMLCSVREMIVFAASRDSYQGGAFQGPFVTFSDALRQVEGGDIDEIEQVLRIDLETMTAEDITEDASTFLVNRADGDWRGLPSFCQDVDIWEWEYEQKAGDK